MVRMIAFESSSLPGSLALFEDDQLRVNQRLPDNEKTTQSFARMIRDAILQANWHSNSINAFAICQGPGSFTGLRIGVTAAKTFAYATGAKIVAVNTLHVIAAQANTERPIWAVMDAQRNQVFAAEFQSENELTPTRIYDDGTDWIQRVSNHLLIGGGLTRYLDRLPQDVTLADRNLWTPSATTLGRMALQKLKRGEVEDMWKLCPEYYRKSAAEEKLD